MKNAISITPSVCFLCDLGLARSSECDEWCIQGSAGYDPVFQVEYPEIFGISALDTPETLGVLSIAKNLELRG